MTWGMQPIASSRLLLRDFEPSDAGGLAAVLCDPEVMRFSLDGPLPAAALPAWIAGSRRLGRWALVEAATAGLVGYGAVARDARRWEPDEAELGIRLARPFWGRGYGTEAGAALIRHGLGPLVLRRILASVDPGNAASIAMVERPVMFDGYSFADRLNAIGAAPQRAGP